MGIAALKKVNGYTNYPTWAVINWMGERQGYYESVAEGFDYNVERMAEWMKDQFVDECVPENDHITKDLMRWVSSVINWHELADNITKDAQSSHDDVILQNGDDCPDCGNKLHSDDKGLYCSSQHCSFEADWVE